MSFRHVWESVTTVFIQGNLLCAKAQEIHLLLSWFEPKEVKRAPFSLLGSATRFRGSEYQSPCESWLFKKTFSGLAHAQVLSVTIRTDSTELHAPSSNSPSFDSLFCPYCSQEKLKRDGDLSPDAKMNDCFLSRSKIYLFIYFHMQVTSCSGISLGCAESKD